MKNLLILIIILSTFSLYAKSAAISPEFYTGMLLVGENKYHMSLGFETGGGIRIGKRHLISYDIGISRQTGGFMCGSLEPTRDWVIATGFNYFFMPLKIKEIFGWEFGIRNGLNRNEFNEIDGYFGLVSRLTLGTKRVKFYYTGTTSMSLVRDLFGGVPDNDIYVYNISSGVSVSLSNLLKTNQTFKYTTSQ